MINSIKALQKAANYLISAGLDNIQSLSISVYNNTVTLGAYPSDITESENRRLKAQFGPMEVDGTGDYKKLVGELTIGSLYDSAEDTQTPVIIKYTINNAFTCRRIPKEELAEYNMASLLQAAQRGDIELPECKPQAFKPEPEPEEF